jgi:hypothetical protein
VFKAFCAAFSPLSPIENILIAQCPYYRLPNHKAGKGYFIMRAKGMGSQWHLNGKIRVLGNILLSLLDSLVFFAQAV